MQSQYIGTWPTGTYGLAAPKTGCPAKFVSGIRKHDTEDSNSNNYWTSGIHLGGKLCFHWNVFVNEKSIYFFVVHFG